MYLDDVAIIALVPGIVEIAKRIGLDSRFAGLLAIVAATMLVAANQIGGGVSAFADPARWIVLGVVYGLAASGLYSQVTRIQDVRRA
ncbi:hypothetical protein BH24CHL4_BH24CHL4_15040 [soil metagenome]